MVAWAALIPAIASAASTAGSLYSANQQSNAQGAAQSNSLQMAMQNYLLQKQMAEQQQRMAEAGRTDAAGNRVYFNGKDWVAVPTDATRGIISASQFNEREQQVKGGQRREFGQTQNFADRGEARNLAQSVLRELRDRAGAPTLEGVRGRNAVAAATKIGGNRDTLVDAVARNAIRSGNINAAGRAVDSIDDGTTRNLRTALAENDAVAPEQFRVAEEGWTTGRLNKFNPLNAVGSNITDSPFSPTQIGVPIDASLSQAATAGAATSGRGGAGLNAAAGLTNAGYGMIPSQMPWGSAIGALGDTVMAYLKNRDNGGGVSPITKKGSTQEYF